MPKGLKWLRNKVSQALKNVLAIVVARNDVRRKFNATLLSWANSVSEGVLVLVLKPKVFSVNQITWFFDSQNLFEELIDYFDF